MAVASFNWFGYKSDWDPVYGIIQTTITDTWGDWAVPALVKTGTQIINGVEYETGQLYLLVHENPITPPTPTFTYNNVLVEGNPQPMGAMGTWNYYAPGVIPGGGYEYDGFRFVSNGVSNIITGFIDEHYTFNSEQDILDAIDAGQITPTRLTCYFDVYINGSDQPSIFANWTAGEELSPVTLVPEVYFATDAVLSPEAWEIDIDGVMQPNTGLWNIQSAGDYSYAGSLSTTYVSIMDAFSQYLNPISKITQWGFDGIPAHVYLYLRMDYGEQIGDLHRVQIAKDGTPVDVEIADSSYNATFYTVVRFHTGEPDYILPQDPETYPGGSNISGDGDGKYDPDNLPDIDNDFDPYEGIGFDGNAVLTKTYAVSAATLQNIGQKLWSQSYFDVLKIQSNPIENIIAVKHFPFAMTGAATNIQVGDVSFGINGDKVASVQVMDIGSVTYTGHFNSYLDLGPYVTIKINLPYIGLVQLDPADLYKCELSVKYYIDLVTGQCMARLTLDGIPYMTVFGQMGVDIPLTSSDRVQTELRAASAAVTAMAGSAGQVLSGNVGGGVVSGLSDALSIMGADYNSQRTSSQSPTCASYENHAVFLMIERPMSDAVFVDGGENGYKHLHGYPCHKYLSIKDPATNRYNFKPGHFIQIERRTDIKIAGTSDENRMLEELLTSGVYV